MIKQRLSLEGEHLREAKQLAIDYRKQMISNLNAKGIGFLYRGTWDV